MKSVLVYTCKSYREFLKRWTEAQETRGLLSRLCQAMDCQNSHLTRVLKEQVHLTMDQAFGACAFLGFSNDETTYFLKLVEHDRAASPLYRARLREEMATLKKEYENLARKFTPDRVGSLETEMTYYSGWHWIAIHFLTAIPQFQTSVKIATRLALPESFVKNCLEILERYGLVKRAAPGWKINSGSVYLPKTSAMNSVQHGNWRNRAVLRSQDRNDDGMHFTMVQTLSHDDFENVKHLLNTTIDKYRKIADPSQPEEICCFTLDFFRA